MRRITAAFLPHLIVRAPALHTTGDDEYKEMVCIEAAAVERAISVAAGEQWEAGQTLTWDPACTAEVCV